MRQFLKSGSVRGVRSNPHPYRDPEGHLVGMVSLRDTLLRDLNEKDDEVRMMGAYIHCMPDASLFCAPRRPGSRYSGAGVSSLRPQALSSPLSVAKTDFFPLARR